MWLLACLVLRLLMCAFAVLLHLLVGALTFAWCPSHVFMTTTGSAQPGEACASTSAALGITLGFCLVSFGPLFASLVPLTILRIPFLGVCLQTALSIVAMSVALVLLVLFGLSTAAGAKLCAGLKDAGTLEEVPLQLLAQHGNHVHAFTTFKVWPVVPDYDVVNERTVILDDIGTNRATGYVGFVTTFHLFH